MPQGSFFLASPMTPQSPASPLNTSALLALAAALCAPGWVAYQTPPSGTAINSFVALVGAAAALWALACARLDGARFAQGLCLGLIGFAVVNAVVGTVQVFWPQPIDHYLLARSALPGRATGNVRQPNLLGTVLLWGAIAWVAWASLDRSARWRQALAAAGVGLSMLVLVLSASRTGLFLGLPVLVLWGLFDRRLPKPLRWLLVSAPAMALAAGGALHLWAQSSGTLVGAEARLSVEGMQSVSRWKILADAWTLIQTHPAGVGWGEFNRAWTLTPVSDRAPYFFDHPHNLFLQLVVELGWVVGGGLSLALLGAYSWGTWRVWRRPAADDGEAVAQRAAWALVTVVGLHSMMEYPLWYPYFLLPTLAAAAVWFIPRAAWTWSPVVRNATLAVGLGMALLTGLAAVEYRKVSAIYAPAADDGDSLVQRIVKGHQTFFFSRQADYAAATALGVSPLALEAAERASHVLIDTRLLIAWAKNLHAAGQTDKARYLVARLQEFRKPDGDAWMAECEADPALWHCSPPQGAYTWRDF
ncbi:polymerase [Inhella crocodyli]|uniref:Polymerase n=2 Tax=Inhella crocodyli TaxID=2499851 RepID=A0A437LDX2_9BURK|nr:polymerase [Inhella crocodyli]